MQKKLSTIRESINQFTKMANQEKVSLMDSIEMLWLNADIQRKKTEVIIPESADENILRIRMLFI